ncbi:MAG: tetratricopeptide repeat protein, partial [Verrucomicrobia bacterium]|nr:tetratricopeptide repeat protein [Verrucomicrobiota bacterium]
LVWGMNPLGYHLTNLLLHAANTALVFCLGVWLLRRILPYRTRVPDFTFFAACAAGALLYGLHPLRVESVAWVTERRDVLSGFFYLLTVLAYLRRCAHTNETVRNRWTMISLVFLTCSLLSKAWGITLPLVLVVLDIYPLGRMASGTWRKDVKDLLTEKAPYFALCAAAALLAISAQRAQGALQSASDHGWAERCMQAAYGLCFYPAKTIWPAGLSPLYLLEQTFNPWEPIYILCALIVAGLTFAVTAFRRAAPGVCAAWFAYVLIVLPVLGLAQSGPQLVADRYSYLAAVPFSLVAAGALLIVLRLPGRAIPRFAAVAVAVAIGLLNFQARRQTAIWHDGMSLWNHAVERDPENYIAYNNRGNVYRTLGDRDKALDDYMRAILLFPAYADAHSNRGNLLFEDGEFLDALAEYNAALESDPSHALAHFNRARIYMELRDYASAREDYTRVIRLQPGLADAWLNRAACREKLGDLPGAVQDMREALRRADPNWPTANAVRQAITTIEKRPTDARR